MGDETGGGVEERCVRNRFLDLGLEPLPALRRRFVESADDARCVPEFIPQRGVEFFGKMGGPFRISHG